MYLLVRLDVFEQEAFKLFATASVRRYVNKIVHKITCDLIFN